MILITGDSIAENANYEALGAFLEKMHAPLGAWSVRGNWEHWRPFENDVDVYQATGVTFLNNSSQKLTEGIWLVGIDDESAGIPGLQNAIKAIPESAFKIGLFQPPAFFDRSRNEFHLALAGHTRGGQLRLPFFPPFWLPEGSGRFVSGWYEEGDSKMYVSRGLERLNPFVVGEVGYLFQDLFDRKHVVEHFFLGRSLDPEVEMDARVRAEVYYLKIRHSPTFQEAE